MVSDGSFIDCLEINLNFHESLLYFKAILFDRPNLLAECSVRQTATLEMMTISLNSKCITILPELFFEPVAGSGWSV